MTTSTTTRGHATRTPATTAPTGTAVVPALPSLRIRPPRPVARTRGTLQVLDVRDDLSRISRANGEIVGYIDRIDVAGGPAYRARRYVAAERRFVALPNVWNADDAVDMLRF